jgi:hypothetical protein
MKLLSKIILPVLPFAMALAAATMSANATQVSGIVWENFTGFDGGNKNATFANVQVMQNLTNPASATYNVTAPLTLTSNSGYTIGAFLGTSGATGVTYKNGAASGDTMQNTLFYMTGNVSLTNNEQFSLTNDDGVQMEIFLPGNTTQFVINLPSPTAPITSNITYTGPTGIYNFALVYASVDGTPADLVLNLPLNGGSVATPDNAWTFALLSVGALGVVVAGRKLRLGF